MKQILWLLCFCAASASAGIIEVTGSASLVSEPTMAILTASVSSEAQTAKEAKKQTDKVMSRVLNAFESANIDGQRYKAGHLQLGPQYNYRSDERELLGYQAQRQLELEVDIDQVGFWLEQFTELGINNVSAPQYQAPLSQKQQDQLLQRALKNALHKAQVLADATEQQLGKVVDVQEQGGSPRPVMYKATMADAESYHAGTVAEQVSLRLKVELN
ncbi:SIMPL domain-containing protein [Ferrimonas lipolytica]|uniref:SIMPL domain-containing protein n=1 Tax=Ferrimonas lipolytica TaxID=2724191 RepID=A0A6H1UF77_9GAMM|nr:SIMPL domain-containing protein [Ferrimonas lipolytica]QIZ76866.1 SIMPL domain-containing protein [Ferrimonas lipolytica]